MVRSSKIAMFVGLLSCGGSVLAQGVALPPERQVVDANGVDLLSGQFTVSESHIDIGPAEARLSYARSYSGNGSDTTAKVSSNTGVRLLFAFDVAYLTIGGRTQTLDVSEGLPQTTPQGEVLSYDGAPGRYMFTQRDGTVIWFYNGHAQTIVAPDGTTTEFALEVVNGPGQNVHRRARSISNNAGYQMKLAYSGKYDLEPSAAYVLNRTAAYCDPLAVTCPAMWSALFVSTPINYVTNIVSATDAMGGSTQWELQRGATTGKNLLRSKRSSVYDTAVNFGRGGASSCWTVTSVMHSWQVTNYQTLTCDTNTLVLRVTDALGNAQEYTSDRTNSLLKSHKDALGNVTSFEYDDLRRRKKVTYPEGNYVEYEYDGRGNVTRTRYVPKPGSGLAEFSEWATYPTTCDNPKTCNKPTSTTDGLNRVTEYTYSAIHGGVETVTLPAPTNGAVRPKTTYTYTPLYAWYQNASGSLVQAPTPIYKLKQISACRTQSTCVGTVDEVRTTFGYEIGSASTPSNLLLTSVTQSSGNGSISSTTTMAYDNQGNRISVDGPLAGAVDVVTTHYDLLRRVVGVVGPDPDGGGPLKRRAIRYAYNADSAPLSVEQGTVDGLTDSDLSAMSVLQSTSVTYDSAGRRVRATLGNGGTLAVSQLSYDAAGRIECSATRMNPATFGALPASACTLAAQGSSGPDRIARLVYNADNQVTVLQSGYGTAAQRNENTSTYTPNGKLATVADARNGLTTYEYDGFDRLQKTRYPASAGMSSTSDYEQVYYNNLGQVTSSRLRDGRFISFIYDNLGRLATRDLPGSESDVTYGYDNLGHTTSVLQSGQSLSFGYDALGRLVTQTGPQGTLISDFDEAGRRKRLTWADGFYVDYDYLNTGEMTRIREYGATSGVGVLATYAYDDLGRRTFLTRGNGTTTDYNFDSASQLQQFITDMSATGGDQTVDMTYNPDGQIRTRASSNDAYSWVQNLNGTTNYTPNVLNQYASVGGSAPAYDARGNLESINGTSYGYSAENMLTSASGGVSLTYDPLGRLYQVTSPSSSTRFSYDGDQLIAEYNASNQLLRRYVFGPGVDEPLVWYEGASTTTRRWMHADERGSVIAMSNSAGVLVTLNRYDEYGVPSVSNSGRFQFTGQVWIAELNLYYYKARFYSPTLGRFMQTDPIGYAAGMNLYAYVRGDVINRRDPSGLQELEGPTVTAPRWNEDFQWELLTFENDLQELMNRLHFQYLKDFIPQPHEYRTSLVVACSADVVKPLLMAPGMSAPGAPQAHDGTTRGMVLTGNNPIDQFVDVQSGTIVNVALPGHTFQGTAITTVEPASTLGHSVITTIGVGAGPESYFQRIKNVVVGMAWFTARNLVASTVCDRMNGLPAVR